MRPGRSCSFHGCCLGPSPLLTLPGCPLGMWICSLPPHPVTPSFLGGGGGGEARYRCRLLSTYSVPAPASLAPLALCCRQGGSGLLGTGTLPLAPKLLLGLPPTRVGLGKFNEHLLYQSPCWVLGIGAVREFCQSGGFGVQGTETRLSGQASQKGGATGY